MRSDGRVQDAREHEPRAVLQRTIQSTPWPELAQLDSRCADCPPSAGFGSGHCSLSLGQMASGLRNSLRMRPRWANGAVAWLAHPWPCPEMAFPPSSHQNVVPSQSQAEPEPAGLPLPSAPRGAQIMISRQTLFPWSWPEFDGRNRKLAPSAVPKPDFASFLVLPTPSTMLTTPTPGGWRSCWSGRARRSCQR